jgi:hypothetical protein
MKTPEEIALKFFPIPAKQGGVMMRHEQWEQSRKSLAAEIRAYAEEMREQGWLAHSVGSDDEAIKAAREEGRREGMEQEKQILIHLSSKDPDLDEYDDDTLDWEEENEEYENAVIAGDCRCGAWIFTNDGVKHVADCVCGAD